MKLEKNDSSHLNQWYLKLWDSIEHSNSSNLKINSQYSNFISRFLIHEIVVSEQNQKKNCSIDKHGRGSTIFDNFVNNGSSLNNSESDQILVTNQTENEQKKSIYSKELLLKNETIKQNLNKCIQHLENRQINEKNSKLEADDLLNSFRGSFKKSKPNN